jgi:hypothetical protein
MKTEGVKSNGYTTIYTVYEAGVDFEQSCNLVNVKTVKQYSLHEGYRVWRVEAAIKRNIKTQFYYVAEVNSVAAVNKFLTIHPRLSAIRSVKLLGAEDTTTVLNNPMRYPLW